MKEGVWRKCPVLLYLWGGGRSADTVALFSSTPTCTYVYFPTVALTLSLRKFCLSRNLDVYEQLKTQLWEDDAVTG